MYAFMFFLSATLQCIMFLVQKFIKFGMASFVIKLMLQCLLSHACISDRKAPLI